MSGLLLVDKGVFGDGQRIQLDLFKHSRLEVVGQKVCGDFLVRIELA